MKMNRREMLVNSGKGGLILVAASGSAAMVAGCNASQWIATALADLPTVLQIITSILQVAGVSAGAEVTKYGAEASTDLQTAQSVITAYQTAAASAKPGMLGQIDAALASAQANLSGILNAFHVTDQTLQSTVAGAIGAAMTAVLAIQSLIPAPPTVAGGRRAVLAKSAQKDGREVIVEAFNLIVGKHYPAAVIH